MEGGAERKKVGVYNETVFARQIAHKHVQIKVAHMNSGQLWIHTQDPHRIKPGKIPAGLHG